MEANGSRLAFQDKFKRVLCIYCCRFQSDNLQLYALACRHIFCHDCLTEECRSVGDPNRRECGECKKVAKCAKFSENLPVSFLKYFAPLTFKGFFRAAYFRLRHRKYCANVMSNRLFRMRNAVQQVYQSCKERHDRNKYLKRERATLRQRLISTDYFLDNDIDWLLQISMRRLLGLRFRNELPTNPRFARDYINENSRVPLYKQVLLRNATLSP